MKKDKVLKKWVGKTMKFALLGAVIGLGISIIGGLNRSFWHFDLNQLKLFLQQAFVYFFCLDVSLRISCWGFTMEKRSGLYKGLSKQRKRY